MQEPPLFELYRGDDHALRLEITDDVDAVVDITGWVFKATLSLNPFEDTDDNADVKVDYTVPAGTDATGGIATVLLPNAQTRNLMPEALYFFDLQREAYDSVKTVIAGRVKVKVDVTRRTG